MAIHQTQIQVAGSQTILYLVYFGIGYNIFVNSFVYLCLLYAEFRASILYLFRLKPFKAVLVLFLPIPVNTFGFFKRLKGNI